MARTLTHYIYNNTQGAALAGIRCTLYRNDTNAYVTEQLSEANGRVVFNGLLDTVSYRITVLVPGHMYVVDERDSEFTGTGVPISGYDSDMVDGKHAADFTPIAHVGSGGSAHSVGTIAAAGFISTTDKTKLDGVEAGATADQTAAEILTAIKTVDGSGSGLDADLLDGNESSAFVPTTRTISAGTGLSGGGDLSLDRSFAINLAASLTWTGPHTFQNTLTTRSIIPELTDAYDLGSQTNLWRKGYLSELDTVLFAENTITLLGGWFYTTKDAGTLAQNLLADITNNAVDFGRAMTPNDFVVLRSSLQVEYIKVGILVSGTTYNITRDLDGSGPNAWPIGQPFAVLGNSGNGRIEMNAEVSPRMSITEQGATYNAQTEHVRLGDLAGWQSAGLTGYGWAVGDFAGNKYTYYSPTAGLVVRGTINADAGYLGTLSISGVLGIGASGGIYQGSGTFAAPNVGLKIYNSGGVGLLETWGSDGAGGWVKQVYMDTAGTISAGAGAVLLNKDGVTVKRGTTSHDLTPLPNRFKFIDATTGDISTEMACYLGADDVSGTNVLSIRANLTHRSPSGNEAGRIILTALSASASYPSAAITVGSDLGNGSAGDCYVSTSGVKLSVANAIAVGTNPATAGAIRVPNNQWIAARNAANSADINLIQVDANNHVAFGAPSALVRAKAQGNTTVLTTATWGLLALGGGTFYDTGGMVGASRITVPNDGYYLIQGHTSFPSNATAMRLISLRQNGTEIAATSANAVNGTNTILEASATVWATAGQYFEIWGYQNSGGNLTPYEWLSVNQLF